MGRNNIKNLCEKCGKEIKDDEIELELYKDISDAPNKIKEVMNLIIEQNHHLSKNFCSNKCYNLFFWEDKILKISLYNVLESVAVEHFLNPPLDSDQAVKLEKKDIDELEKYIEQKIKYIEENY